MGVGNTGAIGAAVPLTAADGTLSRLTFGGLSALKALALIIWEHKNTPLIGMVLLDQADWRIVSDLSSSQHGHCIRITLKQVEREKNNL